MAATSTVYGFITDTLFWKKQMVDLDNSVDTGVGYLDDILINYFHKIGKVHDPREQRLDVIGVVLQGNISLLFDVSKMDSVHGAFVDPKENEVATLFNIIEKIYITQDRTESELNRELTNDTEHYGSYIENSVRRSNGYTTTNPEGVRDSLRIYDYIEFDCLMNGEEVHFKLWLSNESFKKNYPLTTITKVIPPCDVKYLLDPSQQSNIIDAVANAADSIFDNIDTGTAGVDHTGILNYRTQWVVSSQNIPEIRFGLMYQGAVPSSLEARAAIRDYLVGLGIAHDGVWESRFPDLFITAQFFLIPMWDNTVERPNSKYGTIYPAIIDQSKLYDDTVRILPSFDVKWIQSHLEVMTNPFNTTFLTVVPDPLNEEYFSLLKVLETYQGFGPDDTNYDYQEANAREFSRYLARAMSILYGDDVPSTEGFSENIFYKRRYLSFSSNKVEYHILYREDFTNTVSEG